MRLKDWTALLQAALRSVGYLLAGRVQFRRNRLGNVLEEEDGDTFTVYRETVLRPAVEKASEDGVVLVFRMEVTDRKVSETLRSVLFDPLANVATPFFAGMPGFRRKLWLAGSRPGAFLELYEWASAEDAERFVALLQSLLDPFDFAGSASFEVVEDDTVEKYIAARSIAWRQAATQHAGRRQRPVGTLLAVAIAALLLGYLAWRWMSNAGEEE